MALSTAAKVALGIATLGVTVVVYDAIAESRAQAKKKIKAKEPATEPPATKEPAFVPPPEPESREEPIGGWEFRWEQAADEAVASCRVDPLVRTFAQAQVCMLAKAFPEAAPWGGGSSTWEQWMFQARDQVRADIEVLVTDEIGGFGANGWQFNVWLLFSREIPACYTEVGENLEPLTHCMATKLFPNYEWPPPALDVSGWQMQAWGYMRDRIQLWIDEQQVSPGGQIGV